MRFIKILFLAMSLHSCNSSYNVVNQYADEFKKQQRFVLTQRIKALEKKTPLQTAYITYARRKEQSAEHLTIYIEFKREIHGFPLEKKGFFKTADQSFEVETLDLRSQPRSLTTTSVVTVVDSTHQATSITDTSTENWLEDKFKFETSKEMLNALKQGKDLKMRFYAGAYPVTLWIDGGNWRKLESLLKL